MGRGRGWGIFVVNPPQPLPVRLSTIKILYQREGLNIDVILIPRVNTRGYFHFTPSGCRIEN